MTKKWLTIMLAGTYVLLATHFVVSNFVHTIGPAWRPSSNWPHGCPEDAYSEAMKPTLVDEIGNEIQPVHTMGFPWITQWTDKNFCPHYSVVRTQKTNFYMDLAYAFGLTILTGAALVLARNSNIKSNKRPIVATKK